MIKWLAEATQPWRCLLVNQLESSTELFLDRLLECSPRPDSEVVTLLQSLLFEIPAFPRDSDRNNIDVSDLGSCEEWMVNVIFNAFHLGPSLENEDDVFHRDLQIGYLSYGPSAFLNCLRSLPEACRPAVARKYVSVSEQFFKDAGFFQELEKMGLYQPKPSLVNRLPCWASQNLLLISTLTRTTGTRRKLAAAAVARHSALLFGLLPDFPRRPAAQTAQKLSTSYGNREQSHGPCMGREGLFSSFFSTELPLTLLPGTRFLMRYTRQLEFRIAIADSRATSKTQSAGGAGSSMGILVDFLKRSPG